RWREQQLGLPPISAEEIETSAEDVPVGDATAKFFELVGPKRDGRGETILGALLPQGDRVLIVKMRAESKLASAEKENFLSFLRSLRSK
ncbi:MAG: hypothetical protein MI757_15165, partial [Pirellulales bacterium]|nr:hypothetical protein [Pirellulales bacterium]